MKPFLTAPRWLLLLTLLMLSGCGIKFLYNQLDWIIPWYIDDFVSLNDQQEQLLDNRLAQYLSQHRQQQLPVYADFFHAVADMAEDGLTSQEITTIFNTTEQFRSDIFSSIPESFNDIFQGLTDRQVQEVEKNMDLELEELKQRFIETEHQKQRSIRADEMTEFLQRWLGDLSDAQLHRVELWSSEFLLIGPEFIQSRTVWQQRFMSILHNRQKDNDFKRQLQALFSDRFQGRTPEHQEKYQHNRKLLSRLYLDIDQSLDSYQRHQLVGHIRDYANDFRELSRE